MSSAPQIELMTPDAEGWSEWIHPLPGYLLQCCGCGLVHEMEAAIGLSSSGDHGPRNDGETKRRVVLFRMRRPAETPNLNPSTREARAAEKAAGNNS